MHVAKLHAALHSIAEELDSCQVARNFTQMESTLDASVRSPSDKSTEAFRQVYENFSQILQDAQTNCATPTRRMIFDKIGATRYIGQGLSDQLATIISANSLALANALQQISALKQQFQVFCDSVQALHDKFHDLNLEHETLPDRNARIGVVIPPELVGSTLDGLATELHEFDDLFKTFQKITGVEPASLHIDSIGPSGFQLFLDCRPTVAVVVAAAVGRIADIYQNLMAIKKLREDLAKQNLPQERIQALQDDEKQLVDKELDDLAKSLLAEHYKSPDKSRSDMKVLLGRDLRFLADRIDRGVLLEVEMAPPSPSSKAARKKLIQTINEHGRALAKLKRSPDPIFFLSGEDFPGD